MNHDWNSPPVHPEGLQRNRALPACNQRGYIAYANNEGQAE